jgi:hypothetical protein
MRENNRTVMATDAKGRTSIIPHLRIIMIISLRKHNIIQDLTCQHSLGPEENQRVNTRI